MVVVMQPSVKGLGAFGAGSVDRAVGPAVDQCADEAFGLAVGLGTVGPGSEVADAARAAGDAVHGRDVGAAVVGDESLDLDAVAGVERCRSSEKSHGRDGLFVGEDLDVGQPGRIVDSDVHELPACGATAVRTSVGLVAPRAGHAVSSAGRSDSSELLDVDMQKLTRPLALIAHRGLQAQSA